MIRLYTKETCSTDLWCSLTDALNTNTKNEFCVEFKSKSQSLVLLEFMKEREAAQLRLQFSISPHDDQVICGAGDQTLLLKTHKHLKPKRRHKQKSYCHTKIVKFFNDKLWESIWTFSSCQTEKHDELHLWLL